MRARRKAVSIHSFEPPIITKAVLMTHKFIPIVFALPVILSVQGMTGPVRAQTGQAASAQVAPQSEEALLRLGDLYSDGTAVPVDYARAYSYYERAASTGSRSATLRVGQMLIHGQGVSRDVKRGLALLEGLASQGEASAMMALADLYSRGDALKMNPKSAIAYYEAAANAGNTTAMLRLGEIYLYGRFEPENPAKAVAYFKRSADAGNAWAMLELGKLLADLLVPKAGSREDGIAMMRKAEAAGIADAVVGLSDTYFQMGKGKAEVQQALALLEDAAAKGNDKAALELVSIYRDGKRSGKQTLVAKNLATARLHFEKYRDRLSQSDRFREQLLLDIAVAKPKNFAALAGRFDTLPPSDKPSALRDVFRMNQPFYIYLAQRFLAARKLYDGPPSGQVNAGTLRALSAFCKSTGTAYFCKDGPMSGRIAELISSSL
jgi:TPR repeat protein